MMNCNLTQPPQTDDPMTGAQSKRNQVGVESTVK